MNVDRSISMEVPGISLTGLYAPVKGERKASIKPGGRALFKVSELNRFIGSPGRDKESHLLLQGNDSLGIGQILTGRGGSDEKS